VNKITSIDEARATIASANYDPMGDDYFVNPGTQAEVERLLACRSDELLKCDSDVLIAVLAQQVASGSESLDNLKNRAAMCGRILMSYAANLFVAAAQASLKASKEGGAR